MLKEWRTGDRSAATRKPSFQWVPAFAHKGPVYVETIEFRVMPEYATMLAPMEAGELDCPLLYSIQPKDVDPLKSGKSTISEGLRQGAVFAVLNSSKPSFDDVKLRKALDLAVDKQAMVKVLERPGNRAKGAHFAVRFGSTGARLSIGIINGLGRHGGRYGLVTVCAALGRGAAGVFERL